MRGYQILTPFITHLNSKGEKCGLMVNRGWIVEDLVFKNFHYRTEPKETITGYIYEGDYHQKYDDYAPNAPMNNDWFKVWPETMALPLQLGNVEDASKVVFKQVDFDPDTRQIQPNTPFHTEFWNWRITPQRHQAYGALWHYLSFGTLFANAAFWLAF